MTRRRCAAAPSADMFARWEDDTIREWEPLCRYVINRWFAEIANVIGYDEMMSEANFALNRALRKYDANLILLQTGRPVRFNTYAIGGIKQHLRWFVADFKNRVERMPTVSLGVSEDDETGLVDVADTIAETMQAELDAACEARERLDRLLKCLHRYGVAHPQMILDYLGGFGKGRFSHRFNRRDLARRYRLTPAEVNAELKLILELLELDEWPKECIARARKKSPVRRPKRSNAKSTGSTTNTHSGVELASRDRRRSSVPQSATLFDKLSDSIVVPDTAGCARR